MEIVNNSETQNLNPIVPQKNIFKILFFVLLGLFLIVLLIIVYLLINIKKTIPQPQNQTTENIILTPTLISEPTSIVTNNNIQDWKTYENNEIGFSFKYPVSYGEVTTNITLGESGSIYEGVFSKNNNLVFGGISIDFSDGRGSKFTDFSGYLNKNNIITYYGVRIYKKEFIIESKAIKKIYKNKNGIEIVIVNGYTDEENENYPSPIGLGEGNTGVMINTNNKNYPGVSFIFTSKITESDLMKILDTFTLTN